MSLDHVATVRCLTISFEHNARLGSSIKSVRDKDSFISENEPSREIYNLSCRTSKQTTVAMTEKDKLQPLRFIFLNPFCKCISRFFLFGHPCVWHLSMNLHWQTNWAPTSLHFFPRFWQPLTLKYPWKINMSFHCNRSDTFTLSPHRGHPFDHRCSSSDWTRLWAQSCWQVGLDAASQFFCLFAR